MSADHADVRNRAMGLVEAAYASWISSTPPTASGKDELHQEYAARRKDLKALGLQAMQSAAVLIPIAVYSKDALVWPRGSGDTLASDPRPLCMTSRGFTPLNLSCLAPVVARPRREDKVQNIFSVVQSLLAGEISV
jgi:hypothetical protein